MEFLLGGVAAIGAGIFTNPLDVIKTRLQLQGELQARGLYKVHYRGFFHAFYAVAKADGVFALQKGLVPALWYQLFLNGVRLGTYDFGEKRGWTTNENGDVSTIRCIVVGALAGMTGAFSGSPFYLVKTHLQSQAADSIAVGYQHKHQGTANALLTIYKSHGVVGLWRGATSSLPRVAIGSASQLVTIFHCKEQLNKYEMFAKRPLLNTFASSIVGGIAVTSIMTPFDVVMTRLYNQGTDAKGRGLLYKGVVDCFFKIWKTEGIYGYYKGFLPNYIRLGPHTILCFVFWDALRGLQIQFMEQHNSETSVLCAKVMEFVIAGIAATGAGIFTNPLDVIKTRLQLQGELQAKGQYAVHYRGFFHAFYAVAKADGLLAVQKGLVPASWYQLVLNGIRLGGYDVAEKEGWISNKKGEVSMVKAVVVATGSGMIGAYFGSPFYLVKTHLQAQAAESVAVGYQHKHTGSFSALWNIYSAQGVVGLWRGVGSSMPRAGIGSASQLVSFSLCKEYLEQYEIFAKRPLFNTFTSSLIGGVAITTFMTPFDVVMTRLYNQGNYFILH
ncbi:Solute carrier family 25 member 35 [Blattella germanica]|nr:Solute carrier family 25 member 35 [Blattella germanica]